MTDFNLVPTSAVADRLNMSRQNVFSLMEKGEIEAVGKIDTVNGTYLFDPAEVERVADLRAKKSEAAK